MSQTEKFLGSCWHPWNSEASQNPAPCRNISFTCSYCFATSTNMQPHFWVICIISFPFSSPNFIPHLLATLMKYPAHRHLLRISVLEPSNVSLGKSGSWEKKKRHASGSFFKKKQLNLLHPMDFKLWGFLCSETTRKGEKLSLLPMTTTVPELPCKGANKNL